MLKRVLAPLMRTLPIVILSVHGLGIGDAASAGQLDNSNAAAARSPATNPTIRLMGIPYHPPETIVEAFAAAPDDPDLQSDHAWYVYLHKSDAERAHRLLEETIKLHPKHALSLARVALLLPQLESSPVEQLAAWERAEEAGWTDDWYLPSHKGYALLRNERPAEALRALEYAQNRYPRHGVFRGLAEAYFKLGDTQKALYYLKWTRLTHPDGLDAPFARQLARRRERVPGSDMGEGRLWKAAGYANRGRWQAAIRSYEEATELPFAQPNLRVWAYTELVDAYLENDQIEEAIAQAETAVTQFPTEGSVRYQLMTLYHLAGRLEDATHQLVMLRDLNRIPQPGPEFVHMLAAELDEAQTK